MSIPFGPGANFPKGNLDVKSGIFRAFGGRFFGNMKEFGDVGRT